MKAKGFFSLLFVVAILFAGCVVSPPPLVPVGKIYPGRYIDIRSPNSNGWLLLKTDNTGMAFGKQISEQSKETFGAQVLIYTLEKTMNKDEFQSHVKDRFTSKMDSERFVMIESDIKYSEQRSYPCVSFTSVVKDKEALTSPEHREILLLQTKTLTCQHPVRQDTAFSIIYSYRGPSLYSRFDIEAQDFIDGVQVPFH